MKRKEKKIIRDAKFGVVTLKVQSEFFFCFSFFPLYCMSIVNSTRLFSACIEVAMCLWVCGKRVKLDGADT